MTVPELVERSGASTGVTYRVVEFLEEEALLQREPRGPITDVAWRRLIERWSEDFGFSVGGKTVSALEPRGLDQLMAKLRTAGPNDYGLTGSVAASFFESYAPPRFAMLYVDSTTDAMDRLGLRPAPTGGNVLLRTPEDPVVYDRAEVMDGLKVVAPSQIALDLLSSPGRGPAEAQALLDWMEQYEPRWRR